MWQNELISDISSWNEKAFELTNDKEIHNAINAQIGCIRESTAFYMGEMSDLSNMYRANTEIKIAPPPYEMCLFEYTHRGNNKFAFMCFYADGVHMMSSYIKNEGMKWCPTPALGYLNNDGSFNVSCNFPKKDLDVRIKKETVTEDAGRIIETVIASIDIINAKNIVIKTVTPPKKVNQKRAKNGKPPLLEYKILEVHKGAITRKDGGPVDWGYKPQSSMAFHMRRGHWVEYTAEKPLFGRKDDERFVGRFWHQSSAVGDKNNGEIVKDYAVTYDA